MAFLETSCFLWVRDEVRKGFAPTEVALFPFHKSPPPPKDNCKLFGCTNASTGWLISPRKNFLSVTLVKHWNVTECNADFGLGEKEQNSPACGCRALQINADTPFTCNKVTEKWAMYPTDSGTGLGGRWNLYKYRCHSRGMWALQRTQEAAGRMSHLKTGKWVKSRHASLRARGRESEWRRRWITVRNQSKHVERTVGEKAPFSGRVDLNWVFNDSTRQLSFPHRKH